MSEEVSTGKTPQKEQKVRIRGYVFVLFLPGLIVWSVTTFIPYFPFPCVASGYLLLGIALFAYIMERINQPGDNQAEGDTE